MILLFSYHEVFPPEHFLQEKVDWITLLLLLNVETGSQELVILSYATACLHPSVSFNINKKNCRSISEDKIAVCEKTAGLRSGNSSDLYSACLKVLVPVKIF